MIAFLQPLPIGDAVSGILAPPAGATAVKVLRKVVDTWAGESDPDAGVVLDAKGETFFLDTSALVNGQAYYYRAYYLIGADWTATPSVQVTPVEDAELVGPHVLNLVRERVELGLKGEVTAGRLHHADGYIRCIKAPPLYNDHDKWPIVSVHLASDSRLYSGIGELIQADVYDDATDEWTSGEGYLSRVTLNVVGWAMNANTRNDLYDALKKVVIGNFPVFYAAGLAEVEVSFSNPDDTETYAAPVYSTVCTFSCVAPTLVDTRLPTVHDVAVTAA